MMRNEHRLKERMQFSLENRQLFLLFLASAVVVSLIFALGVVVGKRLGASVEPEGTTDPLQMLDQLGSVAANDDLTFEDELTHPPKPRRAEKPDETTAGLTSVGSVAGAAAPLADPQARDVQQRPYTLQISSFQDRVEAEQFMRQLRHGGHEPHVVAAQIPGRGLWYRVRIGKFRTIEAAEKAKQAFEREQQLVSYVARR